MKDQVLSYRLIPMMELTTALIPFPEAGAYLLLNSAQGILFAGLR